MPPNNVLALARRDSKGDLRTMDIDRFIERLSEDDIAGLPVVMVGILGKFREGKSTLLNIADRYLTALENNSAPIRVDDFLFAPSDAVTLFKTSHKSVGCTEGIWVTENPYIIRDQHGKTFAVFLLDTQGLCDTASNDSMDSALFLLTSMMCSCTIYNISRILAKDHFELLGQFSFLASKIRSSFYTGKEKVFQDLVILTRDAELGKQYGWKNGQNQLAEKMEKQNKHADTIKQLTKAFGRVRGFLMPRIANEPDDESFTLSPDLILPQFQEHIALFLDELFGPMLTPFQHKNQEYNCGQFAAFLKHIAALFEGGTIPKAESMLETMIRLEFQLASDAAFSHYRAQMFKIAEKSVAQDELQLHHDRCRDEAKTNLSNAAIFTREPQRGKEIAKKLQAEIEEEFSHISSYNASRLEEEENHSKIIREKEIEIGQIETSLQANRLQHQSSMQEKERQLSTLSEKNEADRRVMRAEMATKEAEFQKQQMQAECALHETKLSAEKMRHEMELATECHKKTWHDLVPLVLGTVDSLGGKGLKLLKKSWKMQSATTVQPGNAASTSAAAGSTNQSC